jgi:aspartyl-tRNA(Asn)/glutamyl-tRNA(Gln) amidotransferase subunit B
MSVYEKYEPVIGLEVHIQLLTKSKIFASDPTSFGAAPNTNVSVITLGHPGTLPKTNKKVVEFAIRLGIACNCTITRENHFARKNYFYPDLPKGYQITQDKTPVCTGGFIAIKTTPLSPGRGAGGEAGAINIPLHHIHWEEDAGKSIHDQDPNDSLIDLNRAGVPLLEMVTEPALHSGEEAYKFLTEVRKLVRYLDICDGNMEEGSLRCDANISVRLKGAKELGKRTEVKNMNSFRYVQKAIDYEIKRQIDLLEAGKTFEQETRSFESSTGTTFALRSKEFAHDYRYFPEPDLQPVIVKQEYIDEIKRSLPPLPDQLFRKYRTEFGLSEYDATLLTDSKETAMYFERLISALQTSSSSETEQNNHCKVSANWMMGAVRTYLNENKMEMENFPLPAEKLSELIKMAEDGSISHSVASHKLFPALVSSPGKFPKKLAEEMNLLQVSDSDSLRELAIQAIAKYPEKVAEYKKGKTGLIGLFMGELMKLSGGKADPKIANQLVKEFLDKN